MGFVDLDTWQARQRDYLRHATANPDRTSADSLLAQLARSRVEPGYRPNADVTPADLRRGLDRIVGHVDTSDFDLMRLWLLWHDHREELDPETSAALRDSLLQFRYWYTDPRPGGMVDHKWFWSENHRIIIHSLGYLAGRDLPAERFRITGQTGQWHADRGRAGVIAWLDEKARWGFSEWHSDVYYAEDLQALLLLSEYAEPALADRAAAMLDVFFLDLAAHQLQGNYGVTHGRSYMKDKSRARDQNVHDVIEFLFDTSPSGYTAKPDFTTVLLASSTRYRLPVVLQRIATDPQPVIDAERMGVPLDAAAPVVADPVPPPGTSFTDPAQLEFWWDRGAMTAWQVVPLSLQQIREHKLWQGELFAPLAPILRRAGASTDEGAQYLAYALHCQANAGLLTEVRTVTFRTRAAMLSSAQNYRPGCLGRQYHAWQATLGEHAVVFTTHPGNPDTGTWRDNDLYWNGGVTMPASAQSGPASIHIYAPGFPAEQDLGSARANYLDFTHAFFPTQHFDEVRRVGNWTLGRKGDGYVALYSHRPTRWAPVRTNPAGLNRAYDLIADGGPDNVWIAEVGDRERWGSFDAFAGAVAAADLDVVDLGAAGGVPRGYAVSYDSPGEGRMNFATGRQLVVRDAPVAPVADRVAAPWARVPAGSGRWDINAGGATLSLDLATGQRTATAS